MDGRPAAELWDDFAAYVSHSTLTAKVRNGGLAVLRGRVGSKVTVTAGFPGQAPVTATLVRTRDFVPFYTDFEHKVLDNGYVYVAFRTFTDDKKVITAARQAFEQEFVDENHQPIEGNPAQVDYEVAPTAADWAAGRDPALEKAVELLHAINQQGTE